jgi:hypothetical protein
MPENPQGAQTQFVQQATQIADEFERLCGEKERLAQQQEDAVSGLEDHVNDIQTRKVADFNPGPQVPLFRQVAVELRQAATDGRASVERLRQQIAAMSPEPAPDAAPDSQGQQAQGQESQLQGVTNAPAEGQPQNAADGGTLADVSPPPSEAGSLVGDPSEATTSERTPTY